MPETKKRPCFLTGPLPGNTHKSRATHSMWRWSVPRQPPQILRGAVRRSSSISRVNSSGSALCRSAARFSSAQERGEVVAWMPQNRSRMAVSGSVSGFSP